MDSNHRPHDYESCTGCERRRSAVKLLERTNGIPAGLPKGAKLRQREVARLRQEGYSRQRIATTLGISQASVQKDLARERAAAAPDLAPYAGKA